MAARVIDSHVHLFSHARIDCLRWLDPQHRLYRSHDLDRYEDTGSLDVSAVVFIECDTKASDGNALALEEIQEAAQAGTKVKAIVAWAPLHLGPRAVAEYFSTMSNTKTTALIKGVRVLLQDKAERFCLSVDFLESVNYLGQKSLLFEIGIDVHRRGIWQLANALQLIDSCRDTVFVIDHLAKPDLSKPLDPQYRRLMKIIASYPNVNMKLSGCLTELEVNAVLPHQSLSKHVALNLELFGPSRLIFGSDWPVLELSSTAKSISSTPLGWFTICQDLLSSFGASEQEMDMIFFQNAVRIYNMEVC